jgi:hypothetical protein
MEALQRAEREGPIFATFVQRLVVFAVTRSLWRCGQGCRSFALAARGGREIKKSQKEKQKEKQKEAGCQNQPVADADPSMSKLIIKSGSIY